MVSGHKAVVGVCIARKYISIILLFLIVPSLAAIISSGKTPLLKQNFEVKVYMQLSVSGKKCKWKR